MRKKTYTIYDVCGNVESDIRLLIHIEDADIPGDWQFYESAIIEICNGEIHSKYHVKEWLTSMWQSPSSDVYACSMDGNIHHSKSGKWKVLNLDGRYGLNDIWGINDDKIYCCGLEEVLFLKDKNLWSQVVTNLKKDFIKIRGTSSNDLYMIGETGSLFYYDIDGWNEIDSPTNIYQLSLLCVSPDEIYFCGESGTIFRGSKDSWTRIDDVEFDLWSLVEYQNKVLVAAGEEGVFSVEGDSLIPFNCDVEATGLQVVGEALYAYDINTVYKFDGNKWAKTEYDFEKLITRN